MSKKLFLIIPIVLFFVFEEYQSVRKTRVNSWTDDQKADCAVVLTGGPGRIQEGMSLLNQHRVKKLIVSGVNPNSELQQIFPPLAFYGSVDTEDIILEKKSKTTYGNAQQSIPIIGALKCQTVLLVTSRVHMYRALKVFREDAPKEVEIIPRAIYSELEEDTWRDLSIETVKSLFYKLLAY